MLEGCSHWMLRSFSFGDPHKRGFGHVNMVIIYPDYNDHGIDLVEGPVERLRSELWSISHEQDRESLARR